MTIFSVNDYSSTALQIGSGVGRNQSLEFFEYQSMKSIGKAFHNDGNWYVIINFFANDVLNPLKINLSLVTNQPTWTNDIAGADQAVTDIQSWMSIYPVSATIVSPIGTQSSSTSVSVTLSNDQSRVAITPNILISSGDSATVIISSAILSISFASNGTADALISFDGGTNYLAIPTGTTINLDAAGIMNVFIADCFAYDTDTNTGSSLIITYNTL
jgi:hypothetical protein